MERLCSFPPLYLYINQRLDGEDFEGYVLKQELHQRAYGRCCRNEHYPPELSPNYLLRTSPRHSVTHSPTGSVGLRFKYENLEYVFTS